MLHINVRIYYVSSSKARRWFWLKHFVSMFKVASLWWVRNKLTLRLRYFIILPIYVIAFEISVREVRRDAYLFYVIGWIDRALVTLAGQFHVLILSIEWKDVGVFIDSLGILCKFLNLSLTSTAHIFTICKDWHVVRWNFHTICLKHA